MATPNLDLDPAAAVTAADGFAAAVGSSADTTTSTVSCIVVPGGGSGVDQASAGLARWSTRSTASCAETGKTNAQSTRNIVRAAVPTYVETDAQGAAAIGQAGTRLV